MPVRSKKPCSHPGCGALVQPPDNRCPRHPYLAPPKKRDEADRFYTRAPWREIRAKALAFYGEKCGKCGTLEDLVVHHVKERRDGGSDELSNLEVVCGRCHNREHGRRGQRAPTRF